MGCMYSVYLLMFSVLLKNHLLYSSVNKGVQIMGNSVLFCVFTYYRVFGAYHRFIIVAISS